MIVTFPVRAHDTVTFRESEALKARLRLIKNAEMTFCTTAHSSQTLR